MKKYLAIPATLMAMTPVMASETTGTANQAVVSAMTTAANDMVATGTSIIPIALTVVTLTFAVMFGIRMFKKVSGTRG